MSDNINAFVLKKSDWRIPIWLIILTLVPVIAGISRLIGLSGGTAITPENIRFFASPYPFIIHLFAVTFYCLIGAFQFSTGFRRRNLTWHRLSGRFLIPIGIISAMTGLWMTVFYQIPYKLQGYPLYYFRIFIGSAMILCLILGFTYILKRDISNHRSWMIRAYAIGQGAGTQVLVLLPWMLLLGTLSQLTRDLLMILSWVINLAVAEWLIRKVLKK